MIKDEWEFDAEACCRAIQEDMQWEYEQMRLQDAGLQPTWGYGPQLTKIKIKEK